MSITYKINPDVYKEQKVWGDDGNEDYFNRFRSKAEDLYRSEKFFLSDVLKNVKSCLDVGCCCGGFSEIMKTYNPQLNYTGVDIIPRFIDLAKERYKNSEFLVGDGTDLDFPDDSFELVFSSGILHLNSRYQDIVKEMYRVSSKYILCDFRLTDGEDITGEMDVNLVGQKKNGVLPYVVLNAERQVAFLKSMQPAPASIAVKGYAHQPTQLARINLDKIYMAFFLIEKGKEANTYTDVQINLNA